MSASDMHQIPQALIDEREAELSSKELPTSLTVKVSKQLAALLQCSAQMNDRDMEWCARHVLETWAEKEMDEIRALQDILAEKGETIESWAEGITKKRPQQRAPRRSEHDMRKDLASALQNAGFIVRCEVDTGAGDADIVLYRDLQSTPIAVVECKVSITAWRESHQATGQAQAYAKALKCKQWFVVAMEVDDRLAKYRVIREAGAANAIKGALSPVAA